MMPVFEERYCAECKQTTKQMLTPFHWKCTVCCLYQAYREQSDSDYRGFYKHGFKHGKDDV